MHINVPYLLLALAALFSPRHASRAWAVNNRGRHAIPVDVLGFRLPDDDPVPYVPVDEPIPYQLAAAIAAITPRTGVRT